MNRPRRGGVSLNSDIARRLEGTVAEEQALGGTEVARLIHVIASTFAHRGALMARASRRADWDSGGWVNDPDCYREAMFAAMEALLLAYPNIQEDEMPLLFEGLKSRILTRIAQAEQSK